jgi:large subunit ribosomal protein L21
MYAVIETGGKQHRVELGDELAVELLDAEPGQEIKLERILLVADGERTAVGQPIVADASVTARVLRQERGKKLISFKYRPKARRRVKKGHRQELTVLKITEVRLGARSAAAEAQVAEDKAESERDRIAKAAARQAAEDAALAEKLKARTRTAAAEEPSEKPAATPRARAQKPAAPAKPAKAEPAQAEPGKAEKPATRARGEKAAGPAPRATAPKTAKTPKAPAARTEKSDAEAPARRPTRTKKDE